jgi:hypothetical protein
MEDKDKKATLSEFKDEEKLAEWIAKTCLGVDDTDHRGDPIKDLVNFKCYLYRGFIKEFKNTFPNDIPPTDFDFIFTGSILPPNKLNDYGLVATNGTVEYQGETLLSAAELKYFRKIKNGRCLFIWDNVPGNDNERFIDFLKQSYSIDWVKRDNIKKSVDRNTISASAGNHSLSLSLNNDKTKVNLKIDDSRTDEFIADMENSKLNIYNGRIYPLRYNVGIEQCIINLNFGFYNVELWHFFDPSISKEEIKKYSEQTSMDLLNFGLPIIYKVYQIHLGDKEKRFNGGLFEFKHNPGNPNRYKSNKKISFLMEFISKKRKD